MKRNHNDNNNHDNNDDNNDDYNLVYNDDGNHDNDHNDLLLSLLEKFNFKLPFLDKIIEKLLYDLMITSDLNKNEKKIIKMFLNNLKNTNFAEIKLLYVIIFSNSIKKLIDNIQGEDFKQQLLIKGVSFIFSFIITNTSVTLYKILEDKNIDELLTNILNTYSQHVSYRLLNNIENNNNDEKNFKSDYQSNIELVLKLNKMFIMVIYQYIRLINYMITLYLVPILYEKNGLNLSSFFKTTIINVYSMVVFNTLYKKCENNKKNESITNNENIEYFFSNIEKIVEGKNGDLKKELYEIGSELFKYFNKCQFNKTFKVVMFQNERRRQTMLYGFYETILSLIINNTYLLLGSNKFKVYFDAFANQKFDFKILLKTTGNLLEVLNSKKYKVSNTILWSYEDNYEYAFTLKNLSLEYNSKVNDKLTVLKNINLNFELNKFHFIYGNSGCGKTTLIKAIMKRHPINSGEIKFLGVYNYTYFSILKYLNFISSGSILFPKSLYYNITYKINKNVLNSKKDIIMNEIIKYMNLFELDMYIPTLKNKIATKLSKGQIQKINIIYVIINIMFNNTKLLFLDEITSNVDGPTEKIIYNELRNLNKIYPFTMFYVSHNLSNLQYSDYNYNISLETHTITKNQTQL
jgi:ABC-type multidrug transport system fused ATPase/permease subunit